MESNKKGDLDKQIEVGMEITRFLADMTGDKGHIFLTDLQKLLLKVMEDIKQIDIKTLIEHKEEFEALISITEQLDKAYDEVISKIKGDK